MLVCNLVFIVMKTKNNHNKNLNIFAFDMFGLKRCFHPHYTVLKLSKTTSPDKLFDYDCVTLYNSIVWEFYSNVVIHFLHYSKFVTIEFRSFPFLRISLNGHVDVLQHPDGGDHGVGGNISAWLNPKYSRVVHVRNRCIGLEGRRRK